MRKIVFHNDTEPALDEDTLNDLQDNIENSISYSTNEEEIGIYDGEKLYRRIIKYTTTSGYNHISLTGIANLKEVKFFYGTTKDPRDNNRLPLIYYNNSNDMCRAYYENANNNLIVHCGNDYGYGNAEIILEYTKTS